MNRLLSLALSLCLTTAVVADAKKDLDAMQGDWACESFVRDGTRFPDDDAQALFRNVKGDKYTVYRFRKKVGSGSFKLDATRSPREIDLFADGPARGKAILGIYKMEGDVLTVCFAPPGQKRPSAFAAKEGSGHTLNVWKREKK